MFIILNENIYNFNMKKNLLFFSSLKLYLLISLFLTNSINSKLINQKIHIAYGLDNKYTYPTLVSMISILENASNDTFYTFYLLVEKHLFKEENKIKLKHLEEKYDRCKVIIFELTNENLSNARVNRYPMAAYYRLLLADLIPDVNRVIYLDGDTIVFTDLAEMNNLEMNNNIILGFVDNSFKNAEQFGIKTYKYVTSGVLLINLKKMRKENISKKFFKFIDDNKKNLEQEDQTVINIVLHGRIDLLPPKFGMWNFVNRDDVIKHNNYGDKKLNIKAYNEKEFLKAWKIPSILHFVRAKPWKRKTKHTHREFHEKWWYYAQKSDEFENILRFYGGKK